MQEEQFFGKQQIPIGMVTSSFIWMEVDMG